jgi:hypothetical protein
LAFIGKGWLEGYREREKAGRRDYVIYEIERALELKRSRVFPVFEEGALVDETKGFEAFVREVPKLKKLEGLSYRILRPDPDYRF